MKNNSIIAGGVVVIAAAFLIASINPKRLWETPIQSVESSYKAAQTAKPTNKVQQVSYSEQIDQIKYDQTRIDSIKKLADDQQLSETAIIRDNVQEIKIDLSLYNYPAITVQQGVPLRYIITADAQNLNSCNNEIVIPAYGIAQKLVVGENIIEFTPTESGIFSYSCWMGMINSTIAVVEDLNDINTVDLESQINALPSMGGCCGARR